MADRHAALASAARLHERAVAENLAGRAARGATLVRRALVQLGIDTDTEPGPSEEPEFAATTARLLATLAKSRVEVSGIDPGLQALDRAVRWAVAGGAGSEALLAFLRSQRGLILFRGGRLDAALTEFDGAAGWLDRTPGADLCRLLINRGALLVERGDLRAARADLQRCVDLSRDLELTVFLRIGLHNLGCLEFFAGNLPRALRLMDDGMALDGDTQPGIALLDRARVLLAAGLQSEADEALAEAAGQLARERCWQDVGEVDLTRAEAALLDGDIDAARRLATRARDRFRRHGNLRWRRAAELVLLQASTAADRAPARVLAPTLRLADDFAAAGFGLSARTAWLLAAELSHRTGSLEQARALAMRAGPARARDPIGVRLHTRYVQARLDLATGGRQRARRQLRAGLGELAAYQAQFGSIDLQTASAVHGRRLAALDIEVAVDGGRPTAVFAAVERCRATAARLPAVIPPPDESTAAVLAELRQLVDRSRDGAGHGARAGAAPGMQYRPRIAELQRQLRSKSWQSDNAGTALVPVTLERVRRQLRDEQAAMVSYFQNGPALLALVEQAGRARVVTLGALEPVAADLRRLQVDLDVLAGGYLPARLLAAVRATASRSLQALDAALLRPLHLTGGRLVVIPTGPLGALPWNLLPSLRGVPTTVSRSATAWVAGVAGATPAGPTTVVALAGPDLQRAEYEVKSIEALWPTATALSGGQVTRQALATALQSASVVHVAAHGDHHVQSPLFSSLRLSDGSLFAYELDQQASIAEHVVLSACELGQATVRPGDEALGLTSVLLQLGTRCVVSGVARVNDEVAADTMTRYHAALVAGADAAAALAAACGDRSDLPAPFVCFGHSWQADAPAAASAA